MSLARVALRDPALAAVVVASRPLYYSDGPNAELDRPAQVRAGSGLARVPGGVAVIQDDANFIVVLDDHSDDVHAITLPAGTGGRRQFDDRRGNKAHKLDLEACVAIETNDGTLLLAFGSGSTSARQQVAIVSGWESGQQQAAIVHAPRLYDALRQEHAFAGSELNIEGAVHLGDCIRLFGRGNGAPREGVSPVNATCDLDWPTLFEHLRAPSSAPPPVPTNIVAYDLGALGGIALTFTDAARFRDDVLFTAAAENSPDATRDGRVEGSVIGIIGSNGRTRCTVLTDRTGRPFPAKAEGLVVASGSTERIEVVVDVDDPLVPSALCMVELQGAW